MHKGITTYEQLSRTKVEVLKKILKDTGPRYHRHNPSEWPSQAAVLAAKKKI